MKCYDFTTSLFYKSTFSRIGGQIMTHFNKKGVELQNAKKTY